MSKVALVDDDPDFSVQLALMLEREGMKAELFPSAHPFLAAMPALAPDLVLLDQIMPDITGIDALSRLRALSLVPCIILTGCEDEAIRLNSLEGGADDYVGKDSSPREILARIRIALRRGLKAPSLPLGTGHWEFLPAIRLLRRPDGSRVPLSASELDLLVLLDERRGEAVSREECYRRIFRRPYSAGGRAVDVLVTKLRAKITFGPDAPILIFSIRNVGYVFLGFNQERPARITGVRNGDA
jgi:DNA-binding response OmpR family regulator